MKEDDKNDDNIDVDDDDDEDNADPQIPNTTASKPASLPFKTLGEDFPVSFWPWRGYLAHGGDISKYGNILWCTANISQNILKQISESVSFRFSGKCSDSFVFS